jgi:hypothetical protein
MWTTDALLGPRNARGFSRPPKRTGNQFPRRRSLPSNRVLIRGVRRARACPLWDKRQLRRCGPVRGEPEFDRSKESSLRSFVPAIPRLGDSSPRH